MLHGLEVEADAEEEVYFLGIGIRGEAGKDGEVVFLLELEILGGLQRDVGDGEVAVAVERGSPR